MVVLILGYALVINNLATFCVSNRHGHLIWTVGEIAWKANSVLTEWTKTESHIEATLFEVAYDF